MKKLTFIERYLKDSVIGDFYLVLKSPVDKETVKNIKPYGKQSITGTGEVNQNFMDYFFHNLIISKKGRNYGKK